MIGWKIVCTVEKEEVVAEVCGQPMLDPEHQNGTVVIPVYYNNRVHFYEVQILKSVKVIERK